MMRTLLAMTFLLIGLATGCADVGEVAPIASDLQPAVFNSEGMPIVEINVPALHCDGCTATACGLLTDLPGVVDVKADFNSKITTVAFNESTFDSKAARDALAEQFGEATIVSDNQDSAGDTDLPNDS